MLRSVRASGTPKAVAAGVLFLVFLGVGLAIYGGAFDRPVPVPVRISGGMQGGTYDTLARGLAPMVAEALEVEPDEVVVLESTGSDQNVERLETGAAELAFVQNDTLGVNHTRALAALYEEVLHVLVRPDGPVQAFDDLHGRRVSLGPAGSGTESVAARVLEHFDLEAEGVALSSEESLAALAGGELDAAFILSAFPSDAVAEACENGTARLLGMGSGPAGGTPADALAAVFPFYRSTQIPARTYGQDPVEAVRTISVTALLTAPAGLDADLVRAITDALFARRQELAQTHPVALRFRERFEPELLQVPFHPGAEAHYDRDQPPFLVEYAEAISLGVSLLAAMVSLGVAFVASVQQRDKDRIDQFYRRLDAIAHRVLAGKESSAVLRGEIYVIRREAFERLINEELQANESFTIFQDYLRALLGELDSSEAPIIRTPPTPIEDAG